MAIKLYTSEYVGHGHPDKIADSISDSILDLCLYKNKNSRVAVETMVVGKNVILGGEISGVEISKSDIKECVKYVIELNNSKGIKLLKPNKVKIQNYIRNQSLEIAMGVDKGGAGDQGVMFAYSNNHNEDRLPMPLYLSRLSINSLTKAIEQYRLNSVKNKVSYEILDNLFYDMKAQFTVEYNTTKKQFGKIKHVVFSIHHSYDVSIERIKHYIKHFIINLIDEKYPQGKIEEAEFHINATGLFTIGGTDADCGVTGRKIVVDTYGGYAHTGGGAFSGKDPTKVDRSAALYGRYVANKIVHEEKLANEIEIGISYCIGEAEPMSITLIKNDMPSNEQKIIDYISTFNFTPKNMISELRLNYQKYLNAAMYGHFGKSPYENDLTKYTWERVG